MLANEAVMTFEYQRRKLDNVTVYAEWSPDLNTSNWKTTNITEVIINDDGEVETVSVSLPMDMNRKFVRLKVEKN